MQTSKNVVPLFRFRHSVKPSHTLISLEPTMDLNKSNKINISFEVLKVCLLHVRLNIRGAYRVNSVCPQSSKKNVTTWKSRRVQTLLSRRFMISIDSHRFHNSHWPGQFDCRRGLKRWSSYKKSTELVPAIHCII